MTFFSVKNFERFQHYKDRTPPWIKLYNELLDDYEFARLPDASKFHLVAIWLLASRSENKLPYDPVWVARRINASDDVDLAGLAAAGFIVLDQPLHNAEQDASKALAFARSRETEGEGEKRQSTDANASGASQASLPTSSPPPPDDDSPEGRYWALAAPLEKRGVARSLVGQLANLLGGRFDEGEGILRDTLAAKNPRPYLTAIIRNRKADRAQAPPDDDGVRLERDALGNLVEVGHEIDPLGNRIH